MATTKLYKWLLPVMILVSTTSFAQLFPRDTRTGDIFGQRRQGPVTQHDGTVLNPDGTIVYPDGSVRYPDGRVNRNDRYPDNDRRYQGNHQCSNGCGLPPGQAKKKYGGHARYYAKNKKQCNQKGNRDWDDGDDNERQVRRYPQQYPQTNPQKPRSGHKYPSGKNRHL